MLAFVASSKPSYNAYRQSQAVYLNNIYPLFGLVEGFVAAFVVQFYIKKASYLELDLRYHFSQNNKSQKNISKTAGVHKVSLQLVQSYFSIFLERKSGLGTDWQKPKAKKAKTIC